MNGHRAKVRMYRSFLGDCFLISLPRPSSDYFIMIDCGIILGAPNAKKIMSDVLKDIRQTTGGTIDLLVATHEHWDHISGFVQAAEEFAKLNVANVWLAWTEDPDDEQAKQLREGRDHALAFLRASANRMYAAGDREAAESIAALTAFFGAAGATTRDALEAVRTKANVSYRRPADPPFAVPDSPVRIFALGPPADRKLLFKDRPSKTVPETYEQALRLYTDSLDPCLGSAPPESPFAARYAIPLPAAEATEFFQRNYWAGEAWRRIDTAWLGDAADLALQLDGATNNTSLVLAIELGDGDVLLFAADAQVGNWLSWQDLAWSVDGQTVTGPDLLRRVLLYKVGHHGSHNATLRQKGVEMMDGLKLAMIPVNVTMAKDKHWNHMPLPELVEVLAAKTNGAVLQGDKPAPAGIPFAVRDEPLFLEVTI